MKKLSLTCIIILGVILISGCTDEEKTNSVTPIQTISQKDEVDNGPKIESYDIRMFDLEVISLKLIKVANQYKIESSVKSNIEGKRMLYVYGQKEGIINGPLIFMELEGNRGSTFNFNIGQEGTWIIIFSDVPVSNPSETVQIIK